MAKGSILVGREPIAQPNRADTSKSHARGPQGPEYNPETINQELSYVHERINNLLPEVTGLSPLATTATLPEAIALLNSILSALKESGIIKS